MESTYFRCSTPSKSCQGQFNNITSILPRCVDELNFTAYSFTVVITIRGRHERYPGTHGYWRTGWYPSKFKNLGYCWVSGTEKISEIGYRWVPAKFSTMPTPDHHLEFFYKKILIIFQLFPYFRKKSTIFIDTMLYQ